MKENKKKKDFPDVTLGIVGHCNIESLADIKKILEQLSYFHIVFFKTTSGKLWLKEGERND